MQLEFTARYGDRCASFRKPENFSVQDFSAAQQMYQAHSSMGPQTEWSLLVPGRVGWSCQSGRDRPGQGTSQRNVPLPCFPGLRASEGIRPGAWTWDLNDCALLWEIRHGVVAGGGKEQQRLVIQELLIQGHGALPGWLNKPVISIFPPSLVLSSKLQTHPPGCSVGGDQKHLSRATHRHT